MEEQPNNSGGSVDAATQLKEILSKADHFQKPDEATRIVRIDWHDTPFGEIVLVGDEEDLYFLNFLDEETTMVRRIVHTQKVLKSKIKIGTSRTIEQAKQELDAFFGGTRRTFDTPVSLVGTSFQMTAWEAIELIPFGQTITYADLARNIGRPSSFRAVAQACAQNPIAIIVPCHRVINTGDGIGGYSGGNERKAQLLDFEKSVL